MKEHFKKKYKISEKEYQMLYDITGDNPALIGYCAKILEDGVNFLTVLEIAKIIERPVGE